MDPVITAEDYGRTVGFVLSVISWGESYRFQFELEASRRSFLIPVTGANLCLVAGVLALIVVCSVFKEINSLLLLTVCMSLFSIMNNVALCVIRSALYN